MSNCNNTTSLPLCGTCAQTTSLSSCEGCLDIYQTSCIQYDGQTLVCAAVNTGDYLNNALCSINNVLCDLIDNKGKVGTDVTDTNYGFLSDKLEAGQNIILTGTGSGDNKKIRIDAIIGGIQIDELVRISPTDVQSGFLGDKLIGGECLFLTKVNVGLNEKLRVNIDWNCVLAKLVSLPGYCTTVQNCVPQTSPIECPFVQLNSPAISGSVATFTWASNGTQFNVYVDGLLQPNMPTGSLTNTSGVLGNGQHVIEVVALCNTGNPNRDEKVFLINTVCPVPNQLVATILGGNANLTWVLDGNANNLNQEIDYKFNTSSNWTVAAIVSPITTSYSLPGLAQNKVYNFRVINNCSSGGPSPSTIYSYIEFTCPTISLTSTASSISFGFPHLGGDIDSYVVELFDAGNVNLIQSKVISAPFASTITDTFNGLTASTTYNVKVTVKSGTFNKPCSPQATATTNVPACPAVTGLSFTLT